MAAPWIGATLASEGRRWWNPEGGGTGPPPGELAALSWTDDGVNVVTVELLGWTDDGVTIVPLEVVGWTDDGVSIVPLA